MHFEPISGKTADALQSNQSHWLIEALSAESSLSPRKSCLLGTQNREVGAGGEAALRILFADPLDAWVVDGV